jgi:hypothetical protein
MQASDTTVRNFLGEKFTTIFSTSLTRPTPVTRPSDIGPMVGRLTGVPLYWFIVRGQKIGIYVFNSPAVELCNVATFYAITSFLSAGV